MDDTPSGLLIFGIGFATMLAFVLILWAVNVLPGKLRAIMSSAPTEPRSVSAGLDQSVDQSAPTSLERQTTPAPAPGLHAATPDMDAENWNMPRISSYLTDQEFLVMLARQKNRSGGWRLSANQIVKTVGGDRTEVLKTIRDIREGPPEFRPLTPEQEQNRAELGLPVR